MSSNVVGNADCVMKAAAYCKCHMFHNMLLERNDNFQSNAGTAVCRLSLNL